MTIVTQSNMITSNRTYEQVIRGVECNCMAPMIVTHLLYITLIIIT